MRTSTLASLLALALSTPALAAPPACPYTPDQLAKTLGGSFEPGKEEPGMGGTSCKYNGKSSAGLSVWVIVLHPGGSQDMMRTMTAGGPKAKFEPIAGDADGAARVRAADPNLVDVSYERSGHVVFLRSLGLDHEPDAAKREARASELAAKLLKLPRLP